MRQDLCDGGAHTGFARLDLYLRRFWGLVGSADAGEVQCSSPLSRQWTRKNQAAVSRFSARLSRGKHGDNEEAELRENLIKVLGA